MDPVEAAVGIKLTHLLAGVGGRNCSRLSCRRGVPCSFLVSDRRQFDGGLSDRPRLCGGGGGAAHATAAGNGGNGGTPGGGGGGGGAGKDNNTAGNGGTGARGEIWLIEYEDDPRTGTVGYGVMSG